MSGITAAGTPVAGITQIIGAGPITVLNPFGPITTIGFASAYACSAVGVPGTVEIANQVNSLQGTYLGPGGCPYAINPAYAVIKEEPGSLARFMDFSAGVPIAAGFGAYALDLQTQRGVGTQIASGIGAIALGRSVTASGNDSIAIGNTHTAPSARGIAIGSTCTAGGNNCTAMGYRNTAGNVAGPLDEATAIGRSNFANAQSASAFGVMNNVAVPANLNNVTGVIVGDPQATVVYGAGVNSTTIGAANVNQSLRGTLIGFKNSAPSGILNYDVTLVGSRNYANPVIAPYCTAVGYGNQLTAGGFNSAFGSQNVVSANNYGLVIGHGSTCLGTASAALGYNSYAGLMANNVALGRSCFVSGYSAVAVGVMNNVYAPANLDNDFGLIAGDPQAINAPGINSSALGVGNTATGLRTTAMGFKNVASGQDATALGSQGAARVQQTTNIAGGIIIRRDDGEAAVVSDALQFFAGSDAVILTPEIDLTAAPADYTITLPANCHFWVNEVGIILSAAVAALVTQPTVHFGITGTPAKYLAAVITTLLTAQYRRERYQTLLADDGETSLLFGVTVSAAAGTLVGRAYFKGTLVEDE